METVSRPVNLYRQVTGQLAPAVFDRLDNIQGALELHEMRRARDEKTQHRFRECLRALCLDLFDAYLTDPKLAIGVRRDTTSLTQNPAYPKFVTARPFLDVLNGLVATGYVEQLQLGTEGSRQTTRIRATEQLFSEMTMTGFGRHEVLDTSDTIRLKIKRGGVKVRVQFNETEETSLWRNNLLDINRNNARYNLSLDLDENGFVALEKARYQKAISRGQVKEGQYQYQKIDMYRTSLHRVFNSRDWSEGGRFYGVWWQSIPREYRQHIRIDGKLTCEHDYSSIHLRLIYNHAQCAMNDVGDPYSQPYGEQHRSAVKKAFNVMLNASGMPKEATVPEFKATELGMTWPMFLDGIAQHHSGIKSYFYTGIGRRLQRLEASITEAVLLRFTSMRQPCLPLHDSFITYEKLGDELPLYMEKIAQDHGLQSAPTNETYTSTYEGPTGLVEVDIGSALEELKEQSQ